MNTAEAKLSRKEEPGKRSVRKRKQEVLDGRITPLSNNSSFISSVQKAPRNELDYDLETAKMNDGGRIEREVEPLSLT